VLDPRAARGMLLRRVREVTRMRATRTVDPRSLASLAARMVLLTPVAITRALALTLSTAVLTTTLTAFSPLLRVLAGRRQTGE
jgi:hypothetical protein